MANGHRALITGATGFVGGHLARRLASRGWEVHALVRPDSAVERLRPDTPRIHEHDGTTDSMVEIVDRAQPDVTFHLASHFVASHAAADVDDLIDTNVQLGTQLAEALRVTDRRLLVNTGSAWQHYRDEAYNPVCLYAATKQALEDLLEYFVRTDGLRVVTLVLFDTYGPDDSRSKVLSLLLRAALHGGSLALSPGAQRLNLVHVNDVVSAFEVAAERLLGGVVEGHERYRVDSESPVTLRRLARAVEDATGRTLDIHWGGQPYRRREVMEPWTGGDRLPGWRPEIDIADGLGMMVPGRD